MLNFRNFASEDTMNSNLDLMSNIYLNAGARASAFLSPDVLAKFKEFGTKAISVNRAALALNREMMAPKPR